MVTAENPTLLRLSGVGVPPYSARGLRQTLVPIGQSSQLRRTVNGSLIDISADQFQKYASVISGSDQKPPACDGLWPGRLVTVECIQELCVSGEIEAATEEDTEGTFGRPYVDGSSYVEDGFTFYRPILSMRVVNFSVDTDEWNAQVGWSLSLEEV